MCTHVYSYMFSTVHPPRLLAEIRANCRNNFESLSPIFHTLESLRSSFNRKLKCKIDSCEQAVLQKDPFFKVSLTLSAINFSNVKGAQRGSVIEPTYTCIYEVNPSQKSSFCNVLAFMAMDMSSILL